jgi:hypothetical protein
LNNNKLLSYSQTHIYVGDFCSEGNTQRFTPREESATKTLYTPRFYTAIDSAVI